MSSVMLRGISVTSTLLPVIITQYPLKICEVKLSGCAHVCAAPCHDQVVVPSKGPGEPSIVKKSCPPCAVLVSLI